MALKEYDMDKEFLHLIDNLQDLIPKAINKLDDNVLICECFCVSAGDIRSLQQSEIDFDSLKTKFNLGAGCGSCLKTKEDWVDKIL